MHTQNSEYLKSTFVILRHMLVAVLAATSIGPSAAADNIRMYTSLQSFATNYCTAQQGPSLADLRIPKGTARSFCDCVGGDIAASTSALEMLLPEPTCRDTPSSYSSEQRRFCAIAKSKLKTSTHRCEGMLSPQRDLFYLVIGSEHYISTPQIDGAISFTSLKGIVNGARHIKQALASSGAKNGILLESRDGEYISREDVFNALEKLRLMASKSRNPFLVMYIGGHGIQSSYTKLQYFIPGNFVLKKSTIDEKTRQLDPFFSVYQYSVPIRKLVEDFLQTTGIPYLALIDLCREPNSKSALQTEDFLAAFLGKELAAKGSSGYEIVRNYWISRARFDGYLNPIILSAEPDKVATTASDPLDESGLLSVGPLARRLLIARGSPSYASGLTLHTLVEALVEDERLDPETRTAYSNTGIADSETYVRIFGSSKSNSVGVTIFGTARKPSICCAAAGEPKDRWSGS